MKSLLLLFIIMFIFCNSKYDNEFVKLSTCEIVILQYTGVAYNYNIFPFDTTKLKGIK
jgi:hypothetical protein